MDYVSIIVPIYNMEIYLERCIKSITEQSYKYLDIILVDDGSTDNSAAICEVWKRKDARITYKHQHNSGLGEARNTGMKLAKSEFITFVDSDDWLEPMFVEKILGTMLRSGSEIGLCDINYIDYATNSKQYVKLRLNQSVVSSRTDKSVVNKSRLFAWGKIYKKSLLTKCDFSFPSITYEDIYTPVLTAAAEKISYVPKPLINYLRNRPGSLANDSNNIADIGASLQLLYEKMKEMGIYDDFRLEYKKIAIGQLRFACRKWGSNSSFENKLRKLENTIAILIPELGGITKRKYFTAQSFRSALDKALPYAEQITDDISSAEYTVVFERGKEKYLTGKIIAVPEPETLSDKVTAEFNLAEAIMERL